MRDKDASTRELVERAKAMKAVCDKYSVPFIVNDRCDIAVACDADGVHLGQSDMTCVEARQILGPNKWIGVSCREESLARARQSRRADYVGCGACFGTDSKGDAKVIGVDGVARVAAVARELSLPIVGIGGISPENAADVRAGALRWTVSPWCRASPKPTTSAPSSLACSKISHDRLARDTIK